MATPYNPGPHYYLYFYGHGAAGPPPAHPRVPYGVYGNDAGVPPMAARPCQPRPVTAAAKPPLTKEQRVARLSRAMREGKVHVRQSDWSKFIFTVNKHKDVFKNQHDILLSAVVRDPPLDMVQTIVSLDPAFLFYKQTKDSPTALGLACTRGASAEVVRYLIREMVRYKTLPTKGFAKVYKPCERNGFFDTTGIVLGNMSLDMMKILLEEHPDGALALSRVSSHGNILSLAAHFVLNQKREEVPDFYEKMKMILHAASVGTVLEDESSKGKFLLPHAFLQAIALTGRFCQEKSAASFRRRYWKDGSDDDAGDNILSVLSYIKGKVPGQFSELDDDGNSLLHIFLSDEWASDGADDRYHSKYHDVFGTDIVTMLLDEYPEALTTKNKAGRLPLHLALHFGSPCYKQIAEASPSWTFEAKCPITKLYPFQVVIAGYEPRTRHNLSRVNGKDELHRVGAAFELLRLAPAMATVELAGRSRNEPWLDSDLFKEIQAEKVKMEEQRVRIVALELKYEDMKRRMQEEQESIAATSTGRSHVRPLKKRKLRMLEESE